MRKSTRKTGGGTKGPGTRPNATYYHYTDDKGIKKICQTGKIRKSTNTVRDARAGPGTYLTKMGPSNKQKDIAVNNWGPRAGPKFKRRGRLDNVIAVKLPRKTVKKVDDPGKSVYIVPNKSVALKDCKEVKVYSAKNKSRKK